MTLKSFIEWAPSAALDHVAESALFIRQKPPPNKHFMVIQQIAKWITHVIAEQHIHLVDSISKLRPGSIIRGEPRKMISMADEKPQKQRQVSWILRLTHENIIIYPEQERALIGEEIKYQLQQEILGTWSIIKNRFASTSTSRNLKQKLKIIN